jgi:cell division protein FtsQ
MRGSVRPVAWCLVAALLALPIVGVLNGWFAANRWPVTQLTVQGEFRHVGMEQIRAAVLPRLGKGFFALNLDSVQQAVAALPWVESVEARKRWPDTLILRIYERQPFAHWNGTRLISRQGVLFDGGKDAAAAPLPDLHGPDAQMPEVIAFYADALKAVAGTLLKVSGVALSERGS